MPLTVFGLPTEQRRDDLNVLYVPTELIPTFVGPGGKNINDIKSKVSGQVSIKIMQEIAPGGMQEIQVVGDGWLHAKRMVREKLDELRRLSPGRWNKHGWNGATPVATPALQAMPGAITTGGVPGGNAGFGML